MVASINLNVFFCIFNEYGEKLEEVSTIGAMSRQVRRVEKNSGRLWVEKIIVKNVKKEITKKIKKKY